MSSSSNSSPFWQSVLHAILDSQRTNQGSSVPIVEPVHRPHTLVPPPSSRIQNRQLDMIQEIAYEYNRNFREYQTRIGELLQIVSTSQTQHIPVPIPIPTHRRGFIPSQTDTSFQSNIDEMSNVFMSYYVYPLNRPDPTGLNNTNINEQLLTREQIAVSTQTYGFTAPIGVDALDPSSNVCPISLEPFQLGDVVCEIRECGHKFKRPNLMHWFRRDARCPVCRYDLRDYVHQYTQEYNENTHPPSEEPAVVQDPSLDEILETQQERLESESESEEMPFTQQYSSFQQSIPSSLPQFLQTMTSNFLQQANFDVSGFRYNNNSIEFEFPIQFDASNIDMFFQQYADNNPFLR